MNSLSIYLLKSSTADPSTALTASKQELPAVPVTILTSHDGTPVVMGSLYVNDTDEREPEWAKWLGPYVGFPIVAASRGAGAVLFLKSSGRYFAVTFGHGRMLLDADSYERRFGLKAALNAVDPERMRSAGVRALTENRLISARHVVRDGDAIALDLVGGVDLLQSFEGAITGSDDIAGIAGRDPARVGGEFEVAALPRICKRLLRLSSWTYYRRLMPWFDDVEMVRDPGEVERLNDALEADLTTNLPRFDLFPPDAPNVAVVQYELSSDGHGAARYSDMSPAMMKRIASRVTKLVDPVAALRRLRIRGLDDGGNIVDEWRVWDCLTYEAAEGSDRVLLDSGLWLRVRASFVAGIETDLAELKSSEIEWPDAKFKEREDDFNTRAAKKLGFGCLDKRLIRLDGQTPFELCDLLGSAGELIHVKKRSSGSSGISHLIAQAVVSAETLFHDAGCRDQAERLVARYAPSMANRFGSGYVAASTSVVLALITDATAKSPGVSGLPFFSKVLLRQQLRTLRAHGHDVFVDVIEAAATPV